MQYRVFGLALVLLAAYPAAVRAEEGDFFAGLGVGAGIAGGSSSTKDGGAPFAGGGIVDDVDFGTTTAEASGGESGVSRKGP